MAAVGERSDAVLRTAMSGHDGALRSYPPAHELALTGAVAILGLSVRISFWMRMTASHPS